MTDLSRREDWETPPEIFEPLMDEFGFTIDVCANEDNAKVARYYDEDLNALTHPWGTEAERETCWMNPPFGRNIVPWLPKAVAESRLHTVVAILPAHTDTAWWQWTWTAAEIRFLEGRVSFMLDGIYLSPARFPNAIVIWRPTHDHSLTGAPRFTSWDYRCRATAQKRRRLAHARYPQPQPRPVLGVEGPSHPPGIEASTDGAVARAAGRAGIENVEPPPSSGSWPQ